MTEERDLLRDTDPLDTDPPADNGNGRGLTIVITVLVVAIVVAVLFAGVALVLRLASGPDGAATAVPTLRPTFTASAVAQVTESLEATPTVAPEQTETEAAPTESVATDVPATEAPATEPPSTEAIPTETPAQPQPTKPPSPPPGMASPDYGIQAFLWWRPEVAHRDLGLVKDGGFTWVKQWFAWRDIEGAGKGKYDWETADRVVDQVEEFGLKLVARVDHGPEWAGAPQDNIGDFVDFLAALATRYKGRIHAYQVWNEPNLSREWGDRPPNAREYTQMLKTAYQTIKAIDPNAVVITAGLAPTTELSQRAVPDTQFVQAMYDAGAKPYFDMLGAHGAGYRAPPEMDPGQVATDASYYNVGDPNCPGDACRIYCFRHVEDLRQIMVNNGDASKRVAVLEFGWTIDERTDSPYYWHRVDDQFMQGDYMVRAYKYAKANWQPWIGVMSLIFMPDAKWTRNDEQFWWSVIEPSPVDQLFLKAPYVMLCEYLRTERGMDRCPYLPEG